MNLTIHFGIMPEEVSAKLKPDLERGLNSRSLLVITREDLSKGELFEQAFARYQGLVEAIGAGQFCATLQEQASSDSLCGRCAQEIGKSLSFQVEEYYIPGVKQKMPNGVPHLSVIHIGGVQWPVTDIYIQFPEMGFQSNIASVLVKRILEGLLRVLLSNGYPYQYMLFNAFCAGGSLSAALKPGSQHSATGALSVRNFLRTREFRAKLSLKVDGRSSALAKTDKSQDPFKTQEAMRLFYLKLAWDKQRALSLEGKPLEVHLSSTYCDHLSLISSEYKLLVEQRKEIKKEMRRLGGDVQRVIRLARELTTIGGKIVGMEKAEVDRLLRLITEEESGKTAETISRMLPENQFFSVNVAASMFLDESMKVAGSILLGAAAADANMEDDLLFKMERYIRRLAPSLPMDLICTRVHCDPFECSRSFAEKLTKWAQDRTYQLQDYVDAILWMASGFDDSYLPERMHWTFREALEESEVSSENEATFFYRHPSKQVIIDPFWREIGTDLLADIIKGSAFTSFFTGDRASLQDEVKRIKAQLLQWDPEQGDFSGMTALSRLIQNFLVNNQLAVNDRSDALKVWVRKGSWAGNSEQTLDALNFHGSNLDRAFYVSTNIVALKERGRERIQQLHLMRAWLAECQSLAWALQCLSDAPACLWMQVLQISAEQSFRVALECFTGQERSSVLAQLSIYAEGNDELLAVCQSKQNIL